LDRSGRRAPIGARIGISRFLLWVSITARKFYAKSIRYFEVSFGELESGDDSTTRAILRNCEEVSGGSARSVGNEAGTEGDRRGRKTNSESKGKRLDTVPTFAVNPRKYFSVRFDPLRKAGVRVEASDPIDIYAVSEEEFPEFQKDLGTYTAKYPKQTNFQTELLFGPDKRKHWYLAFENTSDKVIAVHYEVYG
jgi:hypothetical protein